jgi:hypothetical protein
MSTLNAILTYSVTLGRLNLGRELRMKRVKPLIKTSQPIIITKKPN